MANRIKTVEDCASGRDYYELAQRNEWPMVKKGSYIEIDTGEQLIYIPDCARALPKETRGSINAALVKAGLVVGALMAVLVWVVF